MAGPLLIAAATIAAVSSPAVLEVPAMTVAQLRPPHIRFPRTPFIVEDLYLALAARLAMMPSVDELEKW